MEQNECLKFLPRNKAFASAIVNTFLLLFSQTKHLMYICILDSYSYSNNLRLLCPWIQQREVSSSNVVHPASAFLILLYRLI